MAARQVQRDRPAHRVADGDDRAEPECAHGGRGVVGGVLELERARRAQPAPVATVVDADEREALGERLVGGEELQIARRRPAVEQEHDGRGRVSVAMDADEQLAAFGADQPAFGEPGQAERGHDDERTATYARSVPRPTSPGVFVDRAVASWRRRRGTTPPAPDATGFYRAGDPGEGPRGEVLASEPITPPSGAVAWRVRYRTVDAGGRAVAASMAVAAPAGLAPRPRPVAVWVHGAVGVAPGCAPSRVGFEAWYADDLLRHGMVVVAPDLTGLGIEGVTHPYLHGTTAGQSVLDAARAAAALTATGAGPQGGARRALRRRSRRALGEPARGRRRRCRAGGRRRRADGADRRPHRGDDLVRQDAGHGRLPHPAGGDMAGRRAGRRRRRADRRRPSSDWSTCSTTASPGWSACSPATPPVGCASTGSLHRPGRRRCGSRRRAPGRALARCSSSTARTTRPCASTGPAPSSTGWPAPDRRSSCASYAGADHMGVGDSGTGGRRRAHRRRDEFVSDVRSHLVMTDMPDLSPAAARMAALLDGVPDDALERRRRARSTPLGDLVDHVGGLTIAFTAAAREGDRCPGAERGPSGDASRFGDDWRAADRRRSAASRRCVAPARRLDGDDAGGADRDAWRDRRHRRPQRARRPRLGRRQGERASRSTSTTTRWPRATASTPCSVRTIEATRSARSSPCPTTLRCWTASSA